MKPYLLFTLSIFLFACKKDNKGNSAPQPLAYDSVFTFQQKAKTHRFSTIIGNDRNVVMLVNEAKTLIPTLYKFSQAGALLWKKTIQIPDTAYYGIPRFYSVAETRDGSFLYCGTSYKKVPYNGSFVIGSDIALLKTNSNGDVLWLKSFGGDNDDYGTAIIKTKDGNYLLACNSMSFSADYFNDIYLIKIDADGNVLWTKNYTTPEQQRIGDIVETSEGNFFLNITDNYGTGHANLMWLLIDKNGNEQWRKTAEMGTNAHAGGATQIANGDFVVSYSTTSLFVSRLDKSGNRLWTNNYTSAGNVDYLFGSSDMQVSSNNNITLASNSQYTGTNNAVTFLLNIDGNGKEVFLKKLSIDNNSSPMNLLRADNGNNILTGNQTLDTTIANTFFIKINDY